MTPQGVHLVPFALSLDPLGHHAVTCRRGVATTSCLMCLWDFATKLTLQQGLKQEVASLQGSADVLVMG